MEPKTRETAPHDLILESRSRLTVTGVRRVIRCDPDGAALELAGCVLELTGGELSVTALDLEKGVLTIMAFVLYAIIIIFVSAKTSDILIMGINRSKLCYIITDRGEEISQFLLSHSPRGITMLEGKGMYTGQDHQVLLTCVRPQQIDQLKSAVKQIDERAFVIVGDANEVIGKGFTDMQDKY